MKRGSGETYVRSQSLSSESAVKYLQVGRRKLKIQISPLLGEQDQSNALPQGQQRQSNPHPRTVKNNKNRSTWRQINNFPLAAHFFIHFFAVVLHDSKVKPPETRFMEEMLYVFLFTFFSLPPIFTLVAANISLFLTAAIKF